MQVLDYAAAFAVLESLPVVRIAVYDRFRQACYAVPLAFVPAQNGVQIAVHKSGRLARLLVDQKSGICVEADDVQPSLAFRSVMGTATAQPLADPIPTLAALAGRYGAEWGRWRPQEPIQPFLLHLHALQGRISD